MPKKQTKRTQKNTPVYAITFTGKEWCKSQWLAQRGLERGISETGFSYFGARYYDSDLSGLFISVDPMADKYPSISPYAYCAWNPVKLVDPNGEEVVFAGENEKKLYEEYRTLVFSSDEYKAVQNELIELEKSSETFCIRMGDNISSNSESGNFGYNVSTGQFDINITSDNSWTNVEKLSHELKHADQYINRKLFFEISSKGVVNTMNYSIDDEMEAYARQGMFGNTLSTEQVHSQYKYLNYYGKNTVYKPVVEEIQINNIFYNGKGYPRFMYHGWKKDIEGIKE